MTVIDASLPFSSIQEDLLVSAGGDLTAGFELLLPEIYTLSSAEYEALHQQLTKAMRTLPPGTILLKQDWFLLEQYDAERSGEESFLHRASNKHFFNRPYLNHQCRLFICSAAPRSRPVNSATALLLGKSPVPV